jgi:hypothetical protein
MPTNWVVTPHHGQILHFVVGGQGSLHWGVYRGELDPARYEVDSIHSYNYYSPTWEETGHQSAMKEFEVQLDTPV